MKRILLSLTLITTLFSGLKAVTVNLTVPGSLRATIVGLGIKPDTLTNLTITGSMNASDFKDLRDSILLLKNLDISAASIVAYGPGTDHTVKPIFGTIPPSKSFAANVIPDQALNTTTRALPLESIVLPPSIVEIQNSAFASLKSLKSVTFTGTSLTTFGNGVFSLSNVLTDIQLPASVTTIGFQLFKGCSLLKMMNIPDNITSIPSQMFQDCALLDSVSISNSSKLTAIGSNAFLNTPKMGVLYFPSGINSVDSTSFVNSGLKFKVDANNTSYSAIAGVLYNKDVTKLIRCPNNISSLTIPSTVKIIGGSSFAENSIVSVVIPASVTDIFPYAFSSCFNLTTVDNSVAQYKNIGVKAFYKTTSLKNFVCPANLEKISNNAFLQSGVASVSFNAGLKVIEDLAFYTTPLVNVDLSACTSLSLGNSVFKSTTSLVSAKLPDNMTVIPSETFMSSSLKSFSFPSSLKSINSKAFYFADQITRAELPQTLESIGEYAFDGCSSLTYVYIPPVCNSIANQAFSRTKANFTVSESNTSYKSVGSILYNFKKNKILTSTLATKGFYAVPTTVDSIADYAFYLNDAITKLALPKSLKSIGKLAFSGCAGVTAIYCDSETPYVFVNNASVFQSISKVSCIVYVPTQNAVTAYTAATVWKDFESIEVGTYNKFYSLKNLGYGYALGISPNGEYITGIGRPGLYKLRLEKDTMITSNLDPSGVAAINDMGWVAGGFKDSTYMVNTAVGPTPVINAGVWIDGKWKSLGSGRVTLEDMGTSTSFGASANVISNDGKYVFGMSYEYKKHGQLVPFRWTLDNAGNVVDTLVYNYPASTIQGSRFTACSADGSLSGGWSVTEASKGMRRAILFKSPTEYKILGPDYLGEVSTISPNGKYVACGIRSRACYYDVDKDTLIFINTPEYGTTAFSAMSDNKVGVGYRQWYDDQGSMVRKAFYWSEKTGYMEFSELLKRFAPEINIEDKELSFDYEKIDVPMGISRDGNTIIGWNGFGPIARWGWALKLKASLDTPERPYNLTANTDIVKRNEVILNWTMTADAKYTLNGFKIYRNDTLISTLTDKTKRSFTDVNVAAGYPEYRIIATYANSFESTYSDRVKSIVFDSYALPYSEDFYKENLDAAYWKANNPVLNQWVINTRYGIDSTPCLLFATNGNSTPYYAGTSVVSKPFDATAVDKLYMSWAHRVIATEFAGKTDTLHFEVSNDIYGTSWTLVKEYPVLSLPQTATSEMIELTDFVKGKFFRLRLRMTGPNKKTMNYVLDNLALTMNLPENVKELQAIPFKNVYTKVFWKEPAGSYGATHSTSGPLQPISNEGTPFIAANMFDSLDMAPFKGKYLTSITAYVSQFVKETTFPTKLSLVVFNGSTMVVNQPVESFNANAWNTFKLNNPVLINADKNFYFGIYVTQHDNGEYPLFTDASTSPVDGKGNLFTEDEGATWQKLSTYSLVHNWNIIGNIRNEASNLERENDVLGYELFRDGVKLHKTFLYNQEYLDADGLEKACYTVKTFYATKGVSPESESVCIDYTDLIQHPDKDITIFPNPVMNKFSIKNLDENARVQIVDLSGHVIFEREVAPLETINVEQIPNGVYVLRIITNSYSLDHKLIKF